jgi:probable O-glycosylation ligase (exosortase A-associated)
MLRNVFVFAIIALGVVYATQGPFYALLFYLWNAYFRPEDWVWSGTVGSLNLSFVIGVYLVLTAALSVRIFRINLRTGLLLLFFTQIVVSTLMSEHVDVSWASLVEFSKVLLVSYLIVVLVSDHRRMRLTLLVIAFSLGFELAKQGWAQTILNPGGQNNNTHSLLGDNNGIAMGAMMLAPIFDALALTASRRWEAYIHRVFLVGVVLRGITTYSRGGFLAAGVVGLFSFIRSPHKIRALVWIASIAIIINTVMPQQFWDRMDTIAAPVEKRDESENGRLHFWQVAISMAQANPLTGVGFDGYKSSYQTYDPAAEYGTMRAVHSVWFGLMAELGYPGLFLFVTIWLLAVRACVRVSAAGKHDPSKRDLRLYANGLLTSLIAFAVGGSFLAAQYSEMLWHFFGLSSALHLLAVSEAPAHAIVAAAPIDASLPSYSGGRRIFGAPTTDTASSPNIPTSA